MEETLILRKKRPVSVQDLRTWLTQRPPFVLLETTRPGPWDRENLFFQAPRAVLTYRPGDDLAQFWRGVEEALAKGFWLAGFWSYEFGYWQNPKLYPLRKVPEKVPLAWLGVFERPLCLPSPLGGELSLRPDFKALRLSLGFSEYAEALGRIKEYIASGDTYQVNFTFKYLFETKIPPEELYLFLRPKQKVAYAACLKTKEFSVLSFSPELFLRRKGPRLWTSPMKGTVRRGRTLAEDRSLARWLATDRKNQAENVMIVDLLRNDLGQVCLPGSVFVQELFKVERYETLQQMISTVEGTLPQDFSWAELWQALFPCGSVTGAPKLRTMQIIAELEKAPRGVYTGAVGYISPSGDFVFNVAIRTLVLDQRGQGEFGIGSGVVWDSDPEKEYEECRLKARFLLEEGRRFALVETMRFEPGQGFPLKDLHKQRLAASAAYFDYPFSERDLEALLGEVAFSLERPAKVRVLLSAEGELEVEAYALDAVEVPVKIGLLRRSVTEKEPFLYHKTTYRPWYEAPRKKAQEQGLFDVVLINAQGELTEGTITNIFLEIDGVLYTPPVEKGLLPGVLRTLLLERGRVKEAPLKVSDLKKAAKVYVGNAVRGLLPVRDWCWL